MGADVIDLTSAVKAKQDRLLAIRQEADKIIAELAAVGIKARRDGRPRQARKAKVESK